MASTTSPPPKRKLDAGQKYLYAVHQTTRKHRSPYITLENETKIRITVAPLDLSSGDAPDGGPRFVEPVPWDEMNDFLERTRPWEAHKHLRPLDEDEDVSKDPYASWALSQRFHQGENMIRYLSYHVEEFPEADRADVYTRQAASFLPHIPFRF